MWVGSAMLRVVPLSTGVLRPRSRDPLWRAVHAERAALADDLALLTEAQWDAPSLCRGWSVRHVVAHLTAAASHGRAAWLRSVAGARFDFAVHNDRRLAEHLGASPQETLARFRAVVRSTTAPPGPAAAWLGEVVVHAQDVRRPLGLPSAVPVAASTAVAELFVGRDLTVDGRAAVRGLRVEATDGPFRAGDGTEPVQGPTLALTMAIAGRADFCDDLTGPGVATLRARCG